MKMLTADLVESIWKHAHLDKRPWINFTFTDLDYNPEEWGVPLKAVHTFSTFNLTNLQPKAQ